jgi:hypothetical protein
VIAVTRLITTQSVPSTGVAIYDTGVQRSNTIGAPVDVLQFAQSGTTLYGLESNIIPSNFRRLSVDSSGVSQIDSTNTLVPPLTKDMVLDAGVIYTSTGLIINPASTPPSVLGNFLLPADAQNYNFFLVRPDSSIGRVFFVTAAQPALWRLYSFDEVTHQVLGWLDLQGVSGTPIRLIRWGAKGLAINTTGGQLIIIQGSLVA